MTTKAWIWTSFKAVTPFKTITIYSGPHYNYPFTHFCWNILIEVLGVKMTWIKILKNLKKHDHITRKHFTFSLIHDLHIKKCTHSSVDACMLMCPIWCAWCGWMKSLHGWHTWFLIHSQDFHFLPAEICTIPCIKGFVRKAVCTSLTFTFLKLTQLLVIVIRGYRRTWMSIFHHNLAVASLPLCTVRCACCFSSLRMLRTKSPSRWSLMETTNSDGSSDSAALHCRCVHSQIERFAILEYSQLETDSGEAYNLHCYLWQDSKAAMRGDPRTLWGLSSSIWPRLDQHMVG